MVANNNQDIKPVPPLIPEKPVATPQAKPEEEVMEEIDCVHCDDEGICHAHGELHICILLDEHFETEDCNDRLPEELAEQGVASSVSTVASSTETLTKEDMEKDEFDYSKNYVQPKIELDGSKDIWESGLRDEIHAGTECPDCRVDDVLISYPAYLYIRSMAEKIDTEFLAYLSFNTKLEEKVLSRIYIPTQKVTSASVDVDDKEKGKRADAVLHKHPGSLNSFSGTDEHNINANHDISILMTENEPDIENWMAQVRFHTKCGRILVKKVKVRIYTPKVKVDISKVTKTVYTYTPGANGYYRYIRPPREGKPHDNQNDNQRGLDDYEDGRFIY